MTPAKGCSTRPETGPAATYSGSFSCWHPLSQTRPSVSQFEPFPTRWLSLTVSQTLPPAAPVHAQPPGGATVPGITEVRGEFGGKPFLVRRSGAGGLSTPASRPDTWVVDYDGVGYLIGDVLWSDRTERAVKDRAIAFLETHFQG